MATTQSLPHTSPTSTNRPSSPQTNTSLNLSVLRRYLPRTHSIITTAPYSVIYFFRPSLSSWEKSGIEGTLFVLRLQDPESYAVFVLNRRGLDNFTLHLTSQEAVELTDEYVIVQEVDWEGEQRVWGLWIFEEEGGSTRGVRERVGGCILGCAGMGEGGGDGEEGGDGQGIEDGDGDGEVDGQVNGIADTRDEPDLMALLNGTHGRGGSAWGCGETEQYYTRAGSVGSVQAA